MKPWFYHGRCGFYIGCIGFNAFFVVDILIFWINTSISWLEAAKRSLSCTALCPKRLSAGPAGLGSANFGRWHQLPGAAKLRSTDDAGGDEIWWIAGAVDVKKLGGLLEKNQPLFSWMI